MLLYEKWRPKSFDDVVGQDATLKQLRSIHNRGNGPATTAHCASGFAGRVFWISGPSGSGKTTIARIIAAEVADAYAIVEIDAQRLGVSADKKLSNGTSSVREFEQMCRFRPIGTKGFHAFIVNEAHNLRGPVVSELQTVLECEHVQATSTWIFTTTTAGQQRLFDTKFDAMPFLSRAVMIELSAKSFLEMATRLQQIAVDEGLDGQPLSAYIDLIRRCSGNMRKALNEIDSGAMIGGAT